MPNQLPLEVQLYFVNNVKYVQRLESTISKMAKGGVMGENCKDSHHNRPLVFLSATTTCPGAGASV